MSLVTALVVLLAGAPVDAGAVERIARASLAMGAPVQLVAAVCVLESGASPARTPTWCGALGVGAGVEAQPRVAARSIARALRRCGGRTTARRWTRALASYRWGRCDAADATGYVARGLRLALAIGGAS